MMEELSTEDQEVTSKIDATNIADELQEAALTNVTQALPSPKEGSPPSDRVTPATTTTSPISTLPPPSELPPQLSSPAPAGTQAPSPTGTQAPPPTVGFVPTSKGSTTTPTFSAMSTATSRTRQMQATPSGQGQAQGISSGQTQGTPTGQTQAYTSTSITTLPSVGSSPSGDPSSVAPPPAYSSSPQGVPPQYTTPPAPMQRPIEATIDLQEDQAGMMGPVYPAPGEPKQAGGGLFGWLPGKNLVSKVVEKTKSSVESMITTLDPGMKEVIYSGGDVSIIVTSTKEVKVAAVRQAFQDVFGRATVSGVESQPGIAPQPLGYTAGLRGAEDRINNLRRSDAIDDRQVVVSIENFIAELLPDRWYDIGCVLLKDPTNNIDLQTYTQATPVPSEYIERVQDQTPPDYNLRWSGLAVTVGQVINQQMPYVSPSDWHLHFTGVSRREILYLASKSLAGLYKQRLPYLPTQAAPR